MRVAFFGNNERGIACLHALSASEHEVAIVVSDPGSGEAGYYRSVKSTALELGLVTIEPEEVNSVSVTEALAETRADIGVLAGYGRIIGRRVRGVFADGCINLHASPLPEYRGAGTLNWQLINGESAGAISIIQVDDGIDTGDILAQEPFPIGQNDAIAAVVRTVNQKYPPLLLWTLDAIADGSVTRRGQDPAKGSYYAKRYPRDGWVNWETATAERVHNTIRALSDPFPGAFVHDDAGILKLWGSRRLDANYLGVPGRVVAMVGDHAAVAASDRGLLVTEVGREDGERGTPRSLGVRAGHDLSRRPR